MAKKMDSNTSGADILQGRFKNEKSD